MGCSSEKFAKKGCAYCGRFFRPHPRLGERQKSCGQSECCKKQRQANRKAWIERNPDCFRGRYEKVKQWRGQHPDYQKQWRAKRREIQDSISPEKRITTLHLVVPDVFKREIQDSILLVRRCGCGSWVAGVPGVPA